MRVTDPIPPPPTTTRSITPSPFWRPLTVSSSARLFVTGATVGPVVDSLHNQCLLMYNVAPITLDWPTMMSSSSSTHHLFASSWTVLPLLGVAYVVLGGLLPRIFEYAIATVMAAQASFLPTKNQEEVTTTAPQLQQQQENSQSNNKKNTSRIEKKKESRLNLNDSSSSFADTGDESSTMQQSLVDLKSRAILAVVTTAIIIKLSEYLTLHPTTTSATEEQDVILLLLTALAQWAILDGSLSALLAASVTSIGGPLSELPFVAHGIWEYLPTAADYFPLRDIISTGTDASSTSGNVDLLLQTVLRPNYQQLGLSSITGPCYFAVTIDAIELGKWFDSMDQNDINDESVLS